MEIIKVCIYMSICKRKTPLKFRIIPIRPCSSNMIFTFLRRFKYVGLLSSSTGPTYKRAGQVRWIIISKNNSQLSINQTRDRMWTREKTISIKATDIASLYHWFALAAGFSLLEARFFLGGGRGAPGVDREGLDSVVHCVRGRFPAEWPWIPHQRFCPSRYPFRFLENKNSIS